MSTDLAVPGVGSLVDLDKPSEVARALADLRFHQQLVDEARRVLTTRLYEEALRQGTRTLHLGEMTVRVSGGDTDDYDLEMLEMGLLAAGCPRERIKELIVPTVTYKLNRSILKQLGTNPAYRAAAEDARVPVVRPLRADVQAPA